MASFNALFERTSGIAEIRGLSLIFVSDVDGAQITLPLSSLQVSLEGINSHHYYFFDRFKPQIRICIQDVAVLEVLAQKGVRSAEDLLAKSRQSRRFRFLLIFSPVLISLGLLLALPVGLALVPTAWLGGVFSTAQERALGQWMFPLIRKQHDVVDDHPAKDKVKALVEYLKNANSALRMMDFDIYISNSSQINAFAAPGNIVIVNHGLIDRVDSIEEFMGVLAHELAHAEQRHAIRSMAGGVGALVGTLMLATFLGPEGAFAVANATDFFSLKYSRGDESAADRLGFQFLREAKISTQGMIHFFSRLSNAQGGLEIPSFVSTHPSSSERIEALKALASESPEGIVLPLPISLEDLKRLH